MVDTGATYTVIPAGISKRIGLKTLKPIKVQLADGTFKRFPVATAMVGINGRSAPATVLVSPAGEVLLGAETLEVLGLVVDPRRRRVKAVHPFAIKAAGGRLGIHASRPVLA
jgi:clan AA aspartic protease